MGIKERRSVHYLELHRWDVSAEEAREIQRKLRPRLELQSEPESVETVAGIDVSYDQGSDQLFAAVVVIKLPDLQVLGTTTARARATFPYIPGLLSFRESPAVLEAWGKLAVKPDCLICDGQGLAHPRRFGIACHLGLLLDTPSIGCAKSLLVGEYRMPGQRRGSVEFLYHRGELVGAVLRTKDGVRPVFVSQGHRISLEKAIEVILACCTKYRLPEPTRRANLLVNELRRGHPRTLSPQIAKGPILL